MTLAKIVHASGGDLYANGKRASIPAPGHSKKDRSASLMIGRTGRVVAHSFGSASVRDILDDLRERGLIDEAGYPLGRPGGRNSVSFPTDLDKVRRAAALWSEGVPIQGTLSERYLRKWRAIARPLSDIRVLRHHSRMPVSVYAPHSRHHLPALMALIEMPDGRATAIEVTYLDAQGRRASALRVPRKTIGRVPEGACVQLDPWAPHMLVGEGFITALSASEILALPCAALLGAGNLRFWKAPAGVEHVTIAADRGLAGERSAKDLSVSLADEGIVVDVALPILPFEDFNQMAQARRSNEGRGEGGVG